MTRRLHVAVQVRLRPALAADAHAAAELLIVTRRELMPFAPSAHADDETRAWVAGVLIPGGGVTVALDAQGAIVGVLAVSVLDGTGWIDQLFVRSTHIGRGIGQALLAHALAQLPRPVQLYTFQANARARAFYEGRGFEVEALTDGQGNEEHCPDVLYRLDAPRG